LKRIITGILLLAVLTMLAGCVSRETYENVQQDLLIAEEAVSDQQAQIAELGSELGRASEALETERGKSAELASSLELTGAELEETQTTLASTEITLADTQAAREDIRVQLADAQEQLRAISETPFGLYYIVDTTAGQQLWSLSDDADETLVDGYVLIRNDEDIKFRPGVRDITLGHWVLMAVSSPGVEVDRDVLSSLVTGPNISPEHIGVGYQDILEHFSEHSADNYGSLMYIYIPCHFEPDLGWVNDYPMRVLEHPQIEYLVNDIYGHHVPARFELLEKPPLVMTLALDPALIVQARESAIEAGVDFEEWLTEAILVKIR